MPAPTVITTTHNPDGLSVFRDSPGFKLVTERVGLLYSTALNQPVALAGDGDLIAHEARSNRPIPTEGSVVLVAEWPPGAASPLHRTLSVDVGVMIAGEVELILDSGESRILKQGDVLLHRGTKHGWKNHSDTETARMVCFVLPSEPIPGANQ
ncbi:hypothetical protein ZTR_04572 [Talaromyces verruculosus]|nr:hypothetical protein ZTR_04572 [Talaromyces verruculosus]